MPPAEEMLKLEVWIRWKPEAARELRLWASSVGTWHDVAAMRRSEISPRSRYRSVHIFCHGAPIFLDDAEVDSRWQTYLGLPVWLDGRRGVIPAGVITLASAEPLDTSSVNEGNLSRLDQAMEEMRTVATRVISPT